MHEKLDRFKAGAAQIGPAKRGRKFPRELKVLGATYAVERRASGCPGQTIASELGVGVLTIRRWCEERPQESATFKRVAIVEDRRRETYSASIGALRVEGLSFEVIVALAKALS